MTLTVIIILIVLYCIGIDLGHVYVRMCASYVLTIRKWREHVLQPSFSRLPYFGAVTRIRISTGTLYISLVL